MKLDFVDGFDVVVRIAHATVGHEAWDVLKVCDELTEVIGLIWQNQIIAAVEITF